MTKPTQSPYGSWKSPITSDLLAGETIGLGRIVLDGQDVFWNEVRPAEEGRYVIVRRTPDGTTTDVTPAPFSARTRVHEYGGAAYVVDAGIVTFSNWDDQRLYRQVAGEEPRPITPAGDVRYADGVVDRRRGRMICVREDHSGGGEPVNALVSIDLAGRDEPRLLVSGNDFAAAPRISPDGAQLAWLTWNHPNMPWNGTELWIGELGRDGSLGQTRRVAGSVDESIFQPEWSPDGTLYFVSDRTGWWNLYRHRNGQSEPLTPMEAEFGKPQWVFGLSTYDFVSPDRMVCTYAQDGVWHLATLDTRTGVLGPIEVPYTEVSSVRVADSRVAFRGGSPTEPRSIVQLDLTKGRAEVLRRSSEVSIDAGYLSVPETIDFPTENGLVAHGFFYPPKNRDYAAPPDERPPLLVVSHGGPTSATSSTLDLRAQYWTSRGIAVLDVNYRGSTGYGRAYRQELEGQWGVVDVQDCINGARFLVARGDVDGERLIIRGGSAGGYTTLCALTFHDAFRAGASYYGVADLEALTVHTHKFESRYLDQLVGPFPERKDLYDARSPIHAADQLSAPVIFFQGLEDKVVPPEQADVMVAALRNRGIPVAYIALEGEQHGFRRADSIKRAQDAELTFYSRVLGFELPESLEPLEIENLHQ
ncbi:MAG: S9 family peptidase [Anaerolineae bacterium]